MDEKSRFRAKISLLTLLLFGYIFTNAQYYVMLDNDTLCVRLDLSRGGAICYISKSSEERNIVNIHDEGRYIQQSYYAGKKVSRQSEGQKKAWSPWAWNPIQVGDCYKNRAKIIDYNAQGNTVYIKSIPMLWDMKNIPAKAFLEQWTTLRGNVVKVKNKLTCQRTDTLYGEKAINNQELPAVYPISALDNLYAYIGDEPFTNAPLSNPEVKNLKYGFWGKYKNNMITENWMAFVNENKWGMAVYNPICSNFLAGISGDSGFDANNRSTSYIAPVKRVQLLKNSVFEYEYYLIIGKLDKIRSEIYKLKKSL